MTLENILKLDDFNRIIDKLSVDTVDHRTPDAWKEEYEGLHIHRPGSVLTRPDKTVGTGKSKKRVETAKLVFNFQKKIVNTAVSFLFGEPITLSSDDNDSDAFQEFKKVWKKMKLNTLLKKFARTVMTETKAALVFFAVPADGETVLRARLLKTSNDEEFYPHFDKYGRLDAFLWKSTVEEDTSEKEITEVRIYLKQKTIIARQLAGWDIKEEINLFGKIPIVYAEQDFPEWWDVHSLIDKFENRVSKLSDTNDYFSSPTVIVKGKLVSMPDKNEVGKLIQIEGKEDSEGKLQYGDIDYLTWSQTPETLDMEKETVRDGIFSLTSTPDLSFQNVKGISHATALTLKLMFMDAILKSKDKHEIFGESLERIISVVSSGIAKITAIKYAKPLADMEIFATFNTVLPDSIAELIDTLITATGGKQVMSQETAVNQNPMVNNTDDEMKRINNETVGVAELSESFV